MPVAGPSEGLHIGGREAHVLQAQRPQRLETKHVADDRGGDVGNRAGLEQVQVIGNVGEVLIGGARYRLDLVGLGAIAVAGSQPVRPHDRPGRRGGLTGHSGGGLDRIDPFLRRDAEQREDIGVLRHITGVPVPHLGVLQYSGLVARGTGFDFGGGAVAVAAVAQAGLLHLSPLPTLLAGVRVAATLALAFY